VRRVRILGGGPAGCCAALAAIREGAEVQVIERSRLPRHKVCGEFLSPEIVPVFDRLGVLDRFAAAEPFRVPRMVLHFGASAKQSRLSEPAWGLSRYTLDHLLWTQALERGANPAGADSTADVIAIGRNEAGPASGERLFGFKAHYDGPVDDAVELFFFDSAYVGINCIEGGATNVCGLAPERSLKSCGFEPESLMERSPALAERLRPLRRRMKWLFTGPLAFRQRWANRDAWLAGDSLSFVDPFTGSGLLCAALTGSLAGRHAALQVPVPEHLRICREAIGRPFLFTSALRRIAASGWAERLVGFVPGRLLFQLTRPQSFGLL
jgi:flavin-dependent dehydrogenase